MLSKKLNDPFYWKNKLETLHCLPGEAVHKKDAMWEKLHDRLQQKSVAGKAKWYWMAAGLLPLISSSPSPSTPSFSGSYPRNDR